VKINKDQIKNSRKSERSLVILRSERNPRINLIMKGVYTISNRLEHYMRIKSKRNK